MAAFRALLGRDAWGEAAALWRNPGRNKVEPVIWRTWFRLIITKPRIPDSGLPPGEYKWDCSLNLPEYYSLNLAHITIVFQPQPGDHEKYGGDPQQPHKLHLVTRIRSGRRRPYWEKDLIRVLGLEKRNEPVVHKNIPSVNEKLKVIKHLVRIKPLKLPHGIPSEEEMSDTYINCTTGELLIRRRLKPVEQKTIDSS